MSELKTWADGMLFKQGEGGVGQRPEQSVGWRNQSLLGGDAPAVAAGERAGQRRRRTRRTGSCSNAEYTGTAAAVATAVQPGSPGEPVYVNVADLGYGGATVRGGGGGRGARAGVRGRHAEEGEPHRDTDAAEFAMLVVLVTVGTPYASGTTSSGCSTRSRCWCISRSPVGRPRGGSWRRWWCRSPSPRGRVQVATADGVRVALLGGGGGPRRMRVGAGAGERVTAATPDVTPRWSACRVCNSYSTPTDTTPV